MTQPQDIRNKAEAAQASYERGRAALYRTDGQKRYSDAEHRERLNALTAERRRLCREAAAEADREGREAQERIESLENRDPSALLSTEELTAASARKAFVEDALGAMDADELAARLASVAASADRPGMYLHYHAARKIMAARRAQGRQTVGIEEPVKSLEAKLFGEGGGSELRNARERLENIQSAGLLAVRLENGARNAAEAYEARLAGRR